MSGYNTVKVGLSAFSGCLMVEVAGTDATVLGFSPDDYRTNFNQAMYCPTFATHVGEILEANLCAALPRHRIAAFRGVLLRRSGTVRLGLWFRAGFIPAPARHFVSR